MDFIKALANSNLLYWRQPRSSFVEVSILLASNGFLLILCKSASFGFENVGATVIMALIAFLLQYFASIACLISPSDEGIQSDAPKLAKSIALVWIISLILFCPNAIPSIRWFDIISSYWVIAAIHISVSLLLFAIYSVHVSTRGASPLSINEFIKQSILLILFYFSVNTLLFYLFVLDDRTHFWILKNYQFLFDNLF